MGVGSRYRVSGGAEGAAGALWVGLQTLGAAQIGSTVRGRSPEKNMSVGRL